MHYERELRPKWHIPASLIGAAAMVAVAMDVRDDWEDRAAKQGATFVTTIPTTLVPTTAESITTTSTTSPEIIQPAISLATGPLMRESGMAFDSKRAVGVDCLAKNVQDKRSNELRLPLDLGSNAISRNPLSEIDRVVFLGRELSRSIVSYTLSDGLAVVLQKGQLQLYSFEVKASGSLLATAQGKFIRNLSQSNLRTINGITYSTDLITINARVNPSVHSNEMLELNIRCN